MIGFSAGGEGNSKEELEAVKGFPCWKHTARVLVGSSSGILGEVFPVRNGIPKPVTAASNAPRPINAYTDLVLRLVWSLCLAKTTRIAN